MTNMKRGEILAEDTRRYQQILEYLDLGHSLDEAGDDPNANMNGQGPDPNQMGGDPGMVGDQGGMPGPNAVGGDPNTMPDTSAAPEAQNPMGDADAGGEGVQGFDPQGGDQTMEDPNGMAGPGMEDPAMGLEEPGPDDNVIDIDDLTTAQDETNSIVQDIQTKFDKLLGVVDKFEKFIAKNDGEIDALKQELEKRNPTPLEKLDLRTVNDSYPFNVKPNDYWKEKEATSNYRVGGDNMEVPEQYDLHQSDVDDVHNWKEIADSLDDSSLTDLTKLFNL